MGSLGIEMVEKDVWGRSWCRAESKKLSSSKRIKKKDKKTDGREVGIEDGETTQSIHGLVGSHVEIIIEAANANKVLAMALTWA